MAPFPTSGLPEAQVEVQPTIGASQPAQLGTAANVKEYFKSRRISRDIQRGTIIHEFEFIGSPDQIVNDRAFAGFREGSPHPWAEYGGYYISNLELEHLVHGGTGANDESQAITLVRAVYKQIPCPRWYEQEFISGSGTRIEWYYRLPQREPNEPQRWGFIQQTLNGVSIAYPVPIYRRKFPKVVMSRDEFLKDVFAFQGTLNGTPFLGKPKGYWRLDSIHSRELYQHSFTMDSVGSVWEIVLTFRGDPVRHHRWASPKYETGANGSFINRPRQPRPGDTEEALYDFADLYSLCDPPGKFDTLVVEKLSSNLCLPMSSSTI